ncbi:hypothetical protein [Natrinema thermotolerans]
MRRTTTVGIALIVTGAFIAVASSGAFDATTADRGTEIQTAADENALLGLEYATDDRTIVLESDDSDGGGGCFFVCADYRYNDRRAVLIEDNTVSGELTIERLSVDFEGDDMTGGDGVRHEATNSGIRVVLGDFRCPSEGVFGSGDQQQQSGRILVDGEFSDGTVTIDLEREINVECVPD